MKVSSWAAGAVGVRKMAVPRKGAMYKETVPELAWGSFPGLQDAPWVLAHVSPSWVRNSANTEQTVSSHCNHQNHFGRLKIQIPRPE